MAITDKKTGVWGLDQTYNKINQGSIWEYSGITRFFTWGGNNYGGSGLNAAPTGRYSSPVQLPADNQWSKITSTGYGRGFLALRTDGTLWSWGRNHKGQLGDNSTTLRSSPVQIGSDTTWGSEFSLVEHSVAIKTDGTLWSWGYNIHGQLGQNNTTEYSSPRNIGGTTWSKVVASSQVTLATKTDNTLWTWGVNDSGCLGQNNRTNYSSPVQIPGTTWTDISIGATDRVGFGIKSDGTLWAWGFGTNNGLTAQNDRVMISSPTQIPGTTWSQIKAGASHAAAIKTDGTLWTWGVASDGTLGLGDTNKRSSPTQVPGTTWSQVSGGQRNTYAIKTDGTLWSWGQNTYGQLGLSGVISGAYNYSSPKQVPGTGWSDPSAAAYDVYVKRTI